MGVDLSCADWWSRIEARRTPIADLQIDAGLADQAEAIFGNLRLPDVPGTPALRDSCGKWIRDTLRAVFGAVDQNTGRRHIGEAFVLVPKKNAKTTSSAAIALVFMLLNERRHADLMIIGPTQKIAETAFEQAKGIIQADPEGYLADRFHVQDHLNVIQDRVTQARLMIRTFAKNVLTGSKPVFTLIDEIHVLGEVAYAADVIRQIRGGMLPFPESFLMMITTQSDHAPAGVFKSELAYARGVRDGRVTENVRTLPVLFEFPEALQKGESRPWLNPKIWPLVNPNMGYSISLDRLREGYSRALEDGENEVRGWATQHLNVEVGLALHSNRWAGADFWIAAAVPDLELEDILDLSDVAVAGIDGGGLDDLFGLGIIGRDRVTREWRHWAHAWVQAEALEKRKEIAPRLRDFEAAGELTICDGPGEATRDLIEAADIIEMVMRRGLLPEAGAIGLDPYGVAALIDELAARGVAEEMMVAVPQGTRLSAAVWGTERKLKDGTFSHCGQDLMAWCVGNAVSEQRGNATLITKQTAGKSKIDPLVAMFNAVELMTRNPAAAGTGRTPWDDDPEFKLRA